MPSVTSRSWMILAAVIIANLVADIMYSYLDPRVRAG